MHSLLVLCGVAGCTTSFILSTLACSRPGGRDNGGSSGRRPRLSSIFVNKINQQNLQYFLSTIM